MLLSVFRGQLKIDISCQFIKCLSLTPESSSHIPAPGAAQQSHQLSGGGRQYRWRWRTPFHFQLSSSEPAAAAENLRGAARHGGRQMRRTAAAVLASVRHGGGGGEHGGECRP